MTTSADRGSDEPFETTLERNLDEIEASLALIERAIEGFDDGTYGLCEICSSPIESDRLEVRASQRRCAAHAIA